MKEIKILVVDYEIRICKLLSGDHFWEHK